MNNADSVHIQPWYRQIWPWVLIALPLSSVVASVTTLLIAAHEPDGLVVDDYYKQGLAINQVIERDRYALDYGIFARGQLDVDSGMVELQLSARKPIATQRCRLALVHPTRADRDRQLTLDYEPNRGIYVGRAESLEPGNWHVLLEPSDSAWRLTGRLTIPGDGALALGPSRD